jgi:23S rRNA (uracil1939-C5)-methyltransferase
LNKGDLVELEIVGYAFEGKGIAKIHIDESGDDDKKFVFFVDHAYPGDIVRAKILKQKRSYAEAEIVDLITPSPFRTDVKCTFFGICGGCKAQDLDYKKQISYKQEQVIDCFERIGKLKDFEINNILPSDNIYYYRNKMEYSFAEKKWLSKEEMNAEVAPPQMLFGLGLHVPGRFDKILDINECWLQSEKSNRILNFTRDFFTQKGIAAHSTKTHTGYLRHLVIKQSRFTPDLMVNLVTLSDDETLFREYSDRLLEKVEGITTIVNNVSAKLSQVAAGDYEKVYFGPGFIYDYIGKYKFRISANSFFQTNTQQAENLYRTALEFAGVKGDEIVYDLFCGAGTISIYFSQSVKSVYGFESIESAIDDAKNNSSLNQISNTHFYKADLNKSFLPYLQGNGIAKADIIISDPPRSGMNPKTIEDILQIKPAKIVYISCNPSTQARDIEMLAEGGYKLVKINPVDMFPHTYHIENVALLVNTAI